MTPSWPSAGEMMTPRPVTLPHDAPISKALGTMRTRGFHEIPVLRNRRLLGMITFESIARRMSWALTTKVEHLVTLAPLVTPQTSLPELAEQLLANGLRAAPVVGRRGELLGVVSRTDMVRALPALPEVRRVRVEQLARAADLLVRETDACRHLFAQIRLIEAHPLPVLDRKGRLVGAVGVADLGGVLWRPDTGGKRDAPSHGSVLDIEVGSIMHSPPVTVEVGSSAADAALLMSREKVSSVFVIAAGKPPRVVGQTELLGLVVGRGRPKGGRARVEDVYVEVSGLRGSGDPALLAEIDGLVASGLHRIAQQVRPALLSLHLAPHATHRTSDITVEARLHTDHGIYYASHTGWNLLAGVAGLMDELVAQTRRAREERRRRGRSGRTGDRDSEQLGVDDPELERRIRSATGDAPGDEEGA
ncbi:MAG TPA: CBS domain-containing protein [Thermoplasmata archaeon]|nr:CBS domain-containing protein [Thermoplasmata archaeon]